MDTSSLVLKWQRFVPAKKKKEKKEEQVSNCSFPQQNSNYYIVFIFVPSVNYLQYFWSAEWVLLLFAGLQPTLPISRHKRFFKQTLGNPR